MKSIFELLILGIFSFLLSYVLTPLIRLIALRFCLTDLPNHRKTHNLPTPLIGGIVIAITLLLIGNFLPHFITAKLLLIIYGGLVMLIVGIIDDKTDMKASYKLAIELCLSFLIALYGIRITSFYGLFGVYEIPVFLQYATTIFLITGAMNAFNLMDGIDGLAGSIALSGFAFLLSITFFNDNIELSKFSIIIMGSLLSFLKFNFSNTYKIFLGDSGSLSLGFLLICLGILSLETTPTESTNFGILYLLLVFLLPIFDFIRVVFARLLRKVSIFHADRTHLHHYLLQIGLSPKKISFLIILMNISIVGVGHLSIKYGYFAMLLTCIIVLFLFYKLIATLRAFYLWKIKIKHLEKK